MRHLAPARRTARALALTLALTLPAAGSAQAASPDSITMPRELLGALLDLSGARRPDVTIGRMPAGYPAALAQAPAEVLGGVSYGGDGATAILVFAGAPDAAASMVVERMQREGWTQPTINREYGGFVPTPSMRPITLCRDSLALFVASSARPGGGSQVRVTRTGARNAPCGREITIRRADPFSDFPIPMLVAPVGARTLNGGGGSGGMDERTVATRLETEIGADSLVAHYAGQLLRAGWTSGVTARATGHVTQLLAHRDAQGREWMGVLAVTALTGTTQRDVSLRVLRRTLAR